MEAVTGFQISDKAIYLLEMYASNYPTSIYV